MHIILHKKVMMFNFLADYGRWHFRFWTPFKKNFEKIFFYKKNGEIIISVNQNVAPPICYQMSPLIMV